MHVCGNALHLVCYHVLQNRAGANMDQVWKDNGELYKEQETTSPFPHLALNNVCNPGTPHADLPVLKGKGAQIRHLVNIVASIWREHMRADHRNDMHVAYWLDHLVSFYRCLDYTDANGTQPFHIPRQFAKQILNHCEAVQLHSVHLAEQQLQTRASIFCWNIVPTLHYFFASCKTSK